MLPERYSTGGETAKERDERSLQEYWDFLKRRRWTIALSVIAVVALVMAFTFRQPPMYEATARVLARGPSPDRPGDVLSSALPVVGEFVDERDIGTQVEVLRSFPILKKGAESAGICKKENERQNDPAGPYPGVHEDALLS